ncbi:MAG: hypothetical protein PHD81_02670 [Candidatus Nanoarchaeia archaeon]|nr:hypothetical protein [Candidatus Nanoarchaeia archaeon]MDD5587989.1 hypothetical protein [Candidatus Nanoarchaeia archaeon]
MTKYDFWEPWRAKTLIEKKAIKSILKARKLIINSIPNKTLVSIYIKGSFVRRDMNKSSDVDIVPIVTKNKYEKSIFKINDYNLFPACVVPLSISELKHNKLFTKGICSPDLRAEPDLFILNLKEYKLIYGKKLNPKDYPHRKNYQIIKDEINKIKKGYIPAYKEGIIKFESLLKEVFWLIEWEQKLKHKKIKHSFKNIKNSLKDKNHIIHDAYAFRIGKYKSKLEKQKFIDSLNKYLENK